MNAYHHQQPPILIIGGSDAGISAALRIKELDSQAEVTVVVADAYPNFSICGLPFFISGGVNDWHSLAHRTIAEIENSGIRLLLNHRVTDIEPQSKQVRVISPSVQSRRLAYDKLLIATGAEPVRPSIPGLDEPGVFLLRWMVDGFAINHFIEKEKPRRAVVVGGGYIGLEMAEALIQRELTVTLLEFAPEILTSFDADLGGLIRGDLESHGVQVKANHGIQGIVRRQNDLAVQTMSGETIATEFVLVATGVQPNTQVAESAGIPLGAGGAIGVDRFMATEIPGIWAAGDCVQTWHRLLQRDVYMPLGTTAHKQGRVAGENMAGGQCEFQGSLGTQSVKIFDQVAARSGLNDASALEAGFQPLTVALETWDHKQYYPGATRLHIRITGDRISGQLLGLQMVGHLSAEVSKRIDTVATALYHEMRVADLCDLDLSYTPPLSSPWDPIQTAAMQWSRE